MLLKSLISLVLILSSSVYAATLQLETPWNVRVEREMQVRAYFTDDAGNRSEVTGDVELRTSENDPVYSNGRILIRFPSLGFGSTHMVTVYARYTDESGQTYSDQKSVTADLTPDYINISGPSYVASRSSAMFRATGYYNGRMADLTDRGSWYAMYGRKSGSGFYWAPQVIPGRGMVYDNIRFNFAARSTSYSVYVQ